MTRGKAPFHIDRCGVHITLDDVPAWVCKQCGEPYFEAQKVDLIQDLIDCVHEVPDEFPKIRYGDVWLHAVPPSIGFPIKTLEIAFLVSGVLEHPGQLIQPDPGNGQGVMGQGLGVFQAAAGRHGDHGVGG